ncbi:hypothetical protein ES705_36393 [subsurface metagenome]
MSTCLNSLPGYQGVCQPPQSKLAQGQYTEFTRAEPGTSIRAERTPGAVAVSGVYGEEPGKGENFPGIPRINSKAVVNSDGFSIRGAVRWLLPRWEALQENSRGPQQE